MTTATLVWVCSYRVVSYCLRYGYWPICTQAPPRSAGIYYFCWNFDVQECSV